jgi:TonB family protein
MRGSLAIALILAVLPALAEDEIPPGVSCDPIGEMSSLLPENVSPPTVLERPEPVYPEAMRLDRVEGKVVFNVVVCSDGVPRGLEVVSEKPAGFREAAIEAVRRWRYEPARQDGVPVAVKLAVQVRFRLLDEPPGEVDVSESPTADTAGVTPPTLRSKFAPLYPDEHRRRWEPGRVVLQAHIEKDGTVGAITAIEATSYAFEVAAREAVRRWIYEPARRQGEPVEVDITIVVAFKLRGSPMTTSPGKLTPPPILHDVPPVYPPALLAERREGSVSVEIFVDRNGKIEKVEILHASDPAFAQAVREAIPRWKFGPGRLDGAATATSLKLTIPFRPPDPGTK